MSVTAMSPVYPQMYIPTIVMSDINISDQELIEKAVHIYKIKLVSKEVKSTLE